MRKRWVLAVAWVAMVAGATAVVCRRADPDRAVRTEYEAVLREIDAAGRASDLCGPDQMEHLRRLDAATERAARMQAEHPWLSSD